MSPEELAARLHQEDEYAVQAALELDDRMAA
jgi:hypothetical protein